MTLTAAIRINGGTPGSKALIGYGQPVTCEIDSLDGVRSVTWDIAGTDDLSATTDYSLAVSGPFGSVCQTTSLGFGTAASVRARVSNGIETAVATAKFYVSSVGGFEVGAAGEQLESGPHGWTSVINEAIRGTGTSGDRKFSCRVIAGAPVALTGLQTVDGVQLDDGDRVLVSAQVAGEENGIYVARAGAWERASDAAQGLLTAGAVTYVSEGSAGNLRDWQCVTPDPIVVGVTSTTWVSSTVSGQVGDVYGPPLPLDDRSVVRWDATVQGVKMALSSPLGPYAHDTGQFSIGSNSVNEQLSVEGAANDSLALFTNVATGANGLSVGVLSTGEGVIGHRDSQSITFSTSNTERARIDSDGLVGIGTSTPAHGLDVIGSVGFSYRTVTGAPNTPVTDTIGTSDHVVYVDTAAIVSLELPAPASADRMVLIIKDAANNAGTNSIQIGGQAIDGDAAGFTIANDGGSATLHCSSVHGWRIV